MKQKVWSENYLISSYLVNLRGKAGLYAMLNLIQDVGWMHAFHLQVKLEKHHAWIFTRQRLSMKDWPGWNETIRIQTWLRPPSDRFLLRDYEVFANDRKIGEGTGAFTVMDMQTRKLAAVDWAKFPQMWREDGSLTTVPEKIALSEKTEELAQFQVRNSDIDMNQHVNNTKYAQWILDSLPIEILKTGVNLHDYDVNFLAEAKSGDVISIQHVVDSSISGPTLTQFQGVRVSDQKPVFAARLRSTT